MKYHFSCPSNFESRSLGKTSSKSLSLECWILVLQVLTFWMLWASPPSPRASFVWIQCSPVSHLHPSRPGWKIGQKEKRLLSPLSWSSLQSTSSKIHQFQFLPPTPFPWSPLSAIHDHHNHIFNITLLLSAAIMNGWPLLAALLPPQGSAYCVHSP